MLAESPFSSSIPVYVICYCQQLMSPIQFDSAASHCVPHLAIAQLKFHGQLIWYNNHLGGPGFNPQARTNHSATAKLSFWETRTLAASCYSRVVIFFFISSPSAYFMLYYRTKDSSVIRVLNRLRRKPANFLISPHHPTLCHSWLSISTLLLWTWHYTSLVVHPASCHQAVRNHCTSEQANRPKIQSK